MESLKHGRNWSPSMWVTYGQGRNTESRSAWLCPPTAKPKGFTSLVEVPHPVWKRMPGPTPTSVSFWRAELASSLPWCRKPGTYGQRALSQSAEKRFAETLDPRVKIQYWAWPATLMRAITTAYAEKDHFEKGKVAASGGSKNGASPSMAIIHDERMTAVHATVSPIWDSLSASMTRTLGKN